MLGHYYRPWQSMAGSCFRKGTTWGSIQIYGDSGRGWPHPWLEIRSMRWYCWSNYYNAREGYVADFFDSQIRLIWEGIVHGDIKPENVLIFKGDSRGFVPKVTDFGYSTLCARNDSRIIMPRSVPWVAPEWHHRGFSFEEATKMDMFSFGMLCFWLLFFTTKEGQSRDFVQQCTLYIIVSDLVRETVITSSLLNKRRWLICASYLSGHWQQIQLNEAPSSLRYYLS
jgi:serine/threonine protein kinase